MPKIFQKARQVAYLLVVCAVFALRERGWVRPNLQRGKARKAHLNILYWLHQVGRGLLDLLYPPRCIGCGQGGIFYCDTCRESIPLVTPPICTLCGHSVSSSGLCPDCVRQPRRIDGVRSVALFDGSLCKAIHQLKYRHSRDIAVPLGQMLVDFWQRTPLPGAGCCCSPYLVSAASTSRRRTRFPGPHPNSLTARERPG